MKPPILQARTHLFVWASLRGEKGSAFVKVQALLPDDAFWPYVPELFQPGVQKCGDLLALVVGSRAYKEIGSIQATIEGFPVCFRTNRKGDITDEEIRELLSAFGNAVVQSVRNGGKRPPRLYTSKSEKVTAGAGAIYEARVVDPGASFKIRFVVPAYTQPSAFDVFVRGAVDRVRKGFSSLRVYDINTYSRSPSGDLVVQGTLKGFSEESAVGVLGRFFAYAHSRYFI